jgi:hypothetical protein
MPFGRGGFGCVFAHGKLIAMGGETETGRADPYVSPGSVYRQVTVYDTVTQQWTYGPQMPVAVHGEQPVFHASSNTVLVTGGGVIAGYSQSNFLQVLSAAEVVVSPTAPPTSAPTARDGCAAGGVPPVAGRGVPTTVQWEAGAMTNIDHREASGLVYDSKLWVFGGFETPSGPVANGGDRWRWQRNKTFAYDSIR